MATERIRFAFRIIVGFLVFILIPLFLLRVYENPLRSIIYSSIFVIVFVSFGFIVAKVSTLIFGTYKIVDFKADLIKYKSLSDNEITGCTPEEIIQVMMAQQVNYLPECYVEFMTMVGKVSQKVFNVTGFFFPEVLNNSNGEMKMS